MATVKTRFYVRSRQFEVETSSPLCERELLLIKLGIRDAFALCEQDELHPSLQEFIDSISAYSSSLTGKIKSLVVVH